VGELSLGNNGSNVPFSSLLYYKANPTPSKLNIFLCFLERLIKRRISPLKDPSPVPEVPARISYPSLFAYPLLPDINNIADGDYRSA